MNESLSQILDQSFLKNISFIHAGNSLIVNIGLSDLAVSIVVIPISIVSLLAMNKDEELTPLSVCKFQWFLAACTFLISVLTLAVSSWTRIFLKQKSIFWVTKFEFAIY